MKRHVRFVLTSIIVCCVVAVRAQAPNDAADVARLVELLQLGPASVVADIGAGFGPLSVGIAPRVAQGKVYSTDINPQRLEDIRGAIAHAGVQNVTVLEGGLSQTNLPAECCDGIFMRDVYHHFGDPPAMNASLFRSLKPGGHLAVIEFAPRSGKTAPPGKRDQGADHGMLPPDLIEELKAARFADVQQVAWPSPGYFVVVATRPR